MVKGTRQRKGGVEDSAWVYGLSNWKNGGSTIVTGTVSEASVEG